jgi:hypothetical protein
MSNERNDQSHPRPFYKYSEADRIKGLALIAAHDGDIVLASRQTTVPYDILLLWSKQHDAGLNKRLERAAYQLIAVMPDKLEEADLKQITSALSVVLTNLDRTEPEEEAVSNDVYERLSRNVDRYRESRRAAGISVDPDDRGGS